MPVLFPTPDEYAVMSRDQRNGVVMAVTRFLRAIERHDLVPLLPTAVQPRYVDPSDAEWADAVQAQARRLLDAMPADPQAAEHRAAL